MACNDENLKMKLCYKHQVAKKKLEIFKHLIFHLPNAYFTFMSLQNACTLFRIMTVTVSETNIMDRLCKIMLVLGYRVDFRVCNLTPERSSLSAIDGWPLHDCSTSKHGSLVRLLSPGSHVLMWNGRRGARIQAGVP